MLLSLPKDSRVLISRYCSGDGGIASFTLGILGATEAVSKLFGTDIQALLHSSEFGKMYREYSESLFKDYNLKEENLQQKNEIKELKELVKELTERLQEKEEELLSAQKTHESEIREIVENAKIKRRAQKKKNKELTSRLKEKENDLESAINSIIRQ